MYSSAPFFLPASGGVPASLPFAPVVDQPAYGGGLAMPAGAYTSLPQMAVHAVPLAGFSGPQPTYSAGLMPMAPSQSNLPFATAPSDPAVLDSRFMEAYQGDLAGGRPLFMGQGPAAQRGAAAPLMAAPQGLYGGGGAPMYLATHPGDPGTFIPPPPPHPGPRGGKGMHHMRGMQHPQLLGPQQQFLMQQPPHQHQQQQPAKRRTQRGMEDNIRRTVYVSYIDLQVTEEMLATSFSECGTVVDCRICGDPNSAMRFAFIEFGSPAEAQKAQVKSGMVLGNSPLRVLPSKTAIVPVSRDLMPRSTDEVERCSRTVYVANIDKKVDRSDVRSFFEQLCGPVSKLRLLGDYAHSTRISFIEFLYADSAMTALNCSGALLGTLPIRVSPSKTPVRSEASHKDRGRGGNQQQQHQQQQRMQMHMPGQAPPGSLREEGPYYAAEQEQLMAMHLAQNAGAGGPEGLLLEATLAQQQQEQQQQQQQPQPPPQQQQLAGLTGPHASASQVLMQQQQQPSPPFTGAAAAAPALLAVQQQQQQGAPMAPQPQLAGAHAGADVGGAPPPALAETLASKYPVIRGATPAAAAAPAATAGMAGAGAHASMPASSAVMPPTLGGPTAGMGAAGEAASHPAAMMLAGMQASGMPTDAAADALASQLHSQLQLQRQQQPPGAQQLQQEQPLPGGPALATGTQEGGPSSSSGTAAPATAAGLAAQVGLPVMDGSAAAPAAPTAGVAAPHALDPASAAQLQQPQPQVLSGTATGGGSSSTVGAVAEAGAPHAGAAVGGAAPAPKPEGQGEGAEPSAAQASDSGARGGQETTPKEQEASSQSEQQQQEAPPSTQE